MPVIFHHYEKCDTCRKARAWLSAAGVAVEERPIAARPPTAPELRAIARRAGVPVAKLFNTSGRSYRALDRERLARMDDDEKLALLAADGMLVKRPILDDGRAAVVGFSEAAYAAWAQGAGR